MESITAGYKYLFKYIIIGDMAVGKSCINSQFLYGQSRETHDITIGVEFGATTVKCQGNNVKLQIWDTAGQENFRSLTRSYYKSAIGALVVYDITRSLTSWLEEIQQNCNSNIRLLLIGNKCDLKDNRQVSTEEGMSFAKENNMMFIETSAKEAKNVQEAFMTLTNEIYTSLENGSIQVSTDFGGVKIGNEGLKIGGPEEPKPKEKENEGCAC